MTNERNLTPYESSVSDVTGCAAESSAAPRFSWKRAALTAALAASLAVPASFGAQLAAPDTAQAAQQDIINGNYEQHAQKLLTSINSYRQSKGLKPVKYSSRISGIAQDESNRAVRDENYNHSMNFLRDSRAGSWSNANEITALSYQVSTDELMRMWKNSPPHNQALLNPGIEVVGIGLTFVDGSLSRSGQPWRLVGTVDGYQYARGGVPSDASTSVKGSGQGYAASDAPQLRGAIGAYWSRNKWIGKPQANEVSLGNGAVSQKFKTDNGRITTVYWTSATGAHRVEHWAGLGSGYNSRGGFSKLGVPVSDPVRGKDTSWHQRFKNPSNGKVTLIFQHPTMGVKSINEKGGIGSRWVANGREHKVGHPITDEMSSGGVVTQKFRNHYTGKTQTYIWTSRGGTKVQPW